MARKATKKTSRRPAAKRASKGSAARRSTSASARSKSNGRRQAGSSKELSDLFHETLKDIYHAEKQILKALPKMAKSAQSDELRSAFQMHRDETAEQVGRLERVFEIIDKRAQTKPCHAIMGLVEEGEEVMQEFKGSDALDAGLLAAAQSVEHYEISRYGTLSAWAQQLGLDEAVELLEETLAEEKRTDETLTQIAESAVNQQAA
jgi:ferritin-like metal-binding protein YciE